MPQIIEVSAVVIRDAAGRVLNVRKRGTHALMLPGGKPEPGEDPRDTALREFHEELGVELDPLRLTALGSFEAAAANEPESTVLAHVYEHPFVEVTEPHAEIEHFEWVDPAASHTDATQMAPLNIEHVFPALAEPRRAPKRITVYIGSAFGNSPAYLQAARDLGTALAEAGIGLVYGGGKVGLMGAIADASLEAGGEVIGVITEALLNGETGHSGLTRLEVVSTMQQRKQRMAELTDAFVALPGGPGTLEEFFEVFVGMTLGIHSKPVALYDVDDYWQPLRETLDSMVATGFSSPAARGALVSASSPQELFNGLTAWQPPRTKWS